MSILINCALKLSPVYLQRIAFFTNFESLKHLIDTYFLSCFSYAPIVWMFCSKAKNAKIDALHKKALKLVTPNESNYDKMRQLNKTTSIHTRNIHFLLVEVFRCRSISLKKYVSMKIIAVVEMVCSLFCPKLRW